MKNIFQSFILSFLLIGVFSLGVNAAVKTKTKKLVFKTSSICETCKSTIEGALKEVDGVLISMVNLSSKKVSVKYNPEKTDEATIQKAVLKSGYSYNELEPAPEDYAKLPTCCKKETTHH